MAASSAKRGTRPLAEPSILPLAWRFARRELRSGLSGFRIFLACLALGVFAIAAVGSVASSMNAALDANSRDMLGGDLEFTLAQKTLAPDAAQFLAGQGSLSKIRVLRGMIRTEDDQARSLVELKAVDQAYPLVGQVVLDPDIPLTGALAIRDGIPGIAVAPSVLDRLHLGIGSKVMLGDQTVELRAVIEKEPDSGISPFVLGPRVLLSDAGLALTGLNKPGTLSSESYRLLLSEGQSPDSVTRVANAAFPNAGWQIRNLKNAAQGVETFIDRTALFLTLVGLTALLVGGVGVGNAVSAYLAGKASIIATFKCLGAPARLILTIYLLQIMALAVLGIVLGLVGGAASPWLAQLLFGQLLPVPLVLRLFPAPLSSAAAFGVLASLSFTLLPLIRTRGVSPAGLFRGVVAPGHIELGFRDWLIFALLGVAVCGLAIGIAGDRRLAIWFLISVSVALITFYLIGQAIVFVARRLPAIRLAWLRLAIANLHRPGAPTVSVVLSLGLGLAVLVAVTLVQASLADSIGSRLAERAPSFFFIDIQPGQVADFSGLVHATPGIAAFNITPSLRTRVVAVNGVPIDKASIDPGQRPLVQSDRGLTYAADLPRGSIVTDGAWWPADYHGEALTSIEEGFAKGLHLKIGDTLSYDIAGRTITARVANFRRVDWRSLGINFFSILAPGTLEGAPQTAIATARLSTPEEEEALSRQVTDRFPNVSSIQIRDQLDRIKQLLAGLAAAIRATAMITLLTGGFVLIGTVAAGHRRRIRDSVILKVLGATRGHIVRGLLVEYGAIGFIAALVSTGVGTLGAALLLQSVMQMEMVFAWRDVALIILGATSLTIFVAVATTWRVLSLRPAPYLRQE